MTARTHLEDQAHYNRLDDETPVVEPFTIWFKRKLRNPLFVIALVALLGGLIALAVLHPWTPAAKTQYTLQQQAAYKGVEKFIFPPYDLEFTSHVRLNSESLMDISMAAMFAPYIKEPITLFHCPNELYKQKSNNETHTVLQLTNVHSETDCVGGFLHNLTDKLPIQIPDGILNIKVDENLVFDRYNQSIDVHMNIMNLIQINVQCGYQGPEPVTARPTMAPTPPTEAPTTAKPTTAMPTTSPTTPDPTETPTPSPTRAPNAGTRTPTSQPTMEPTVHETPTPTAAHPMGTYYGSEDLFGHEIDSALIFLDDKLANVSIQVTHPQLADIECDLEPYTLASSGAITFDNIKEPTDCLYNATSGNHLNINSAMWTASTDTIRMVANYQGLLTVTLDMAHKKSTPSLN